MHKFKNVIRTYIRSRVNHQKSRLNVMTLKDQDIPFRCFYCRLRTTYVSTCKHLNKMVEIVITLLSSQFIQNNVASNKIFFILDTLVLHFNEKTAILTNFKLFFLNAR